MSTLRDILAIIGAALIIGSIATQSLWVAGVFAGAFLFGASIWWSRAVAYARFKETQRQQQERGL